MTTNMTDDVSDYKQLCQRIREGDPSLTEVIVSEGVDSTIVEALSNNSIVTTLSIENAVALGDKIAAVVATMPALTKIRLRNVGLSAGGARKLVSSTAWRNLQLLDLRDNPKLGPRGVQPLAEKLSLVNNLEELNLSNCRIGHFGAKAIGNSSLPPSLKVLDLSHNSIGNDGCWKLAPALKDLVHLESLLLSKNQIGDDGAGEIAHQLPSSLRILIMRDNEIANVGADVIASAVMNGRLKKLILSNNNIGSPGATALSQVVVHSLCLEELDLNGNEIGDDGAAALAKSLVVTSNDDNEEETERKNATLTILRLRDNQIGDAGAGAFVEHLDQNRKLVTLDLAGNEGISSARVHILDMIMKHRMPRRASAGGIVLTPPGSPLRQEQSEQAILSEGRNILERRGSDPVELSSSYLELCTDHFSMASILSYGAFGELYRASDEDETYLIRRVSFGLPEGNREAHDRALRDILALRHKNFLSLQAFSRGIGSEYLVYDYKDVDSLDACISNSDKRKEMTWKIRIKILCGVASALDFLYNGGRRSSFHGDVKSSNVFITDDYTAQLTDCGVSHLVATDEARFRSGNVVFGSRGYRCPRYERGSRKYESDVFSFGIVMAEVCTGRLQNNVDKSTGQKQDFYYDYIVDKKRDLLKDIDALAGTFDERALATLCKIALSSMDSEPMRRPGTTSIVRLLDSILKR